MDASLGNSRGNIGDRVIVHIKNDMSVPTTIHWHGQYQRGSNQMDGSAGITECGIAPSSSSPTIGQCNSLARMVALALWSHLCRCLFGPLILHGDDEKFRLNNPNNATSANTTTTVTSNGTAVRTDYDRDVILVVNDAYQADAFSVAAIARSKAGPPGGDQGSEPVPDYAMITVSASPTALLHPTALPASLTSQLARRHTTLLSPATSVCACVSSTADP